MRSVASQLLIVGLFFCGLPTCVVAEETNRTVKINEILFDALADDAGKEWIELCNTGSKAVDLNGWQLTSRDGLIATLPACRLPAGGFLLVKFGSGTNDIDFSDNAGTCFVVGSPAVLSDSYDEIGLFRGKPSAATIEDFVAYSRNNVREMGSTYRVAVAASIWPVLAVVRQADFVEAGVLFNLGFSRLGFSANTSCQYPTQLSAQRRSWSN